MSNEEKSLKLKNNLLKIDNNFIEGFINNNNIIPMKILFYISRVSNYSKDLEINKEIVGDITTFKLDTKLVCTYCNITQNTLIKNIKKLRETSIKVVDTKEELTEIVLVPKSKILHGKNIIYIDVYNEILNLIIEVEKKYTTIDFTNMMKISNKHSLKILQLITSILNFTRLKDDKKIDISKRKFYSIEELNIMLGVNYKSCSEWERRILKPCQEDLDNTSKLSFTYDSRFTPQERGRPKSLGFYLYPKVIGKIQPTLL